MPHDSEQVAEAIGKMREDLALLDHAGAGATSYAFHLSLAVEVAGQIDPADRNGLHGIGLSGSCDADVGR